MAKSTNSIAKPEAEPVAAESATSSDPTTIAPAAESSRLWRINTQNCRVLNRQAALSFYGPAQNLTAQRAGLRAETQGMLDTFNAGPEMAAYKGQVERHAAAVAEVQAAEKELAEAEAKFVQGDTDECMPEMLEFAVDEARDSLAASRRRVELLEAGVREARIKLEAAYSALANQSSHSRVESASVAKNETLREIERCISPLLEKLAAEVDRINLLANSTLPPAELALPACPVSMYVASPAAASDELPRRTIPGRLNVRPSTADEVAEPIREKASAVPTVPRVNAIVPMQPAAG